MAYVAAAAAAAAAQAEEETMTPYSREDLAENWEFKIMRSATGKFRDPSFLRVTLEEEARAGWTLLEKFDNTRIRVKRPASARANDRGRPIDPYRINVGPGVGSVVLLTLGLCFLLAAVIILGVFWLVGRMTK